jgi:VWFA-related protein
MGSNEEGLQMAMGSRRWIFAGAVAAGLLSGVVRAQTPSQQPAPAAAASPARNSTQNAPYSPQLQRRDDQIMTIESTARLVVLDVVVTDAAGHAVQGLKAQDFHLMEDGVPQTVANFVEHARITPEQAAAEAALLKLPPNTFSNYGRARDDEGGLIVFLIDALDAQVQTQMQLRQQMIAYMKTVPEGTRIAIFQLDTQMHMVQGFTSDPAVLLAAVESKRDMPGFSPMLASPGAGGRGGTGAQMADLQKRMRSDILTQGMQQLGKYLAGFPGRKSLVWFTADIPVWPLGGGEPGFNEQFADSTTFIDEMNRTTDVLRLGQIAVYPVDMRGLTVKGGVGQIYQHGALDDVAAATGGKAFYNTNGIKEAMTEVADESTNYYTLAFSPTNRQFDGSYRKLLVKVTDPRLQLAYRPGYYARNDDHELAQHRAQRTANRGPLTVSATGGASAPATVLDKAVPLGSPTKQDVLFVAQFRPEEQAEKAGKEHPLDKDNFLAKPFRGGGYRNYDILLAVNGRTLSLMPSVDGSYHGKIEVVTMVYDDKGQVVNSLETQAAIDPDGREYAGIMKNGAGLRQTIAVPAKGNFFLRVAVRDVPSDKVGTVEVPVGEIKLQSQLPSAADPVKP